MDEISRIEGLLKKRGFKNDTTGIERTFAWKPDLLLAKDNETRAYLLRQTGTIPMSLIERLASTKSQKRNLFVNVVFLTKPTRDVIKTLMLYGVGIAHLEMGRLVEVAKSKNFLPAKGPKKVVPQHKKMMKTEIFISSKQKIPERNAAWEAIEDIHHTSKFPVYPFKVEDDPRFGGSPAQTKRCIDEGLKRCDWFVGILSDEWRKWVEYEIRQAIKKHFDGEDITIYFKSTKKAETSWNRLLKWIKGKNIKYLPYSQVEDMKTKLIGRVLGKIERVHKRLGIPMYDT